MLRPIPAPRYSRPTSSHELISWPSRSLANGVLAPNRAADARASGAPGQASRVPRMDKFYAKAVGFAKRIKGGRIDRRTSGWRTGAALRIVHRYVEGLALRNWRR